MGKSFPPSGSTRWRCKDPKRFRRRPRALRRDAPGLLRRHGPSGRHGPRRRPRPDVLPVVSRVRRRGTFFRRGGQGARRRMRAWLGTTSSWTSGPPPRPDGGFIPMVMVPFWDVAASVAEVERTAAKGAKSITFTEAPHRLGPAVVPRRPLGSLPRRRPGSRPSAVPALRRLVAPRGSPPDANFAVAIALFGMNSQFTTVDLLLSPVFHKFPRLRVALSEGGIGWIPYVLERTDYTWERHRWYTGVNPRRAAVGPLPRPHLRMLHRRQRRNRGA